MGETHPLESLRQNSGCTLSHPAAVQGVWHLSGPTRSELQTDVHDKLIAGLSLALLAKSKRNAFAGHEKGHALAFSDEIYLIILPWNEKPSALDCDWQSLQLALLPSMELLLRL